MDQKKRRPGTVSAVRGASVAALVSTNAKGSSHRRHRQAHRVSGGVS